MLFGPVPEVETDFANQMLDHYINFINDLDPGAPWPRYTSETKQVLQLTRNNITAIPDGMYHHLSFAVSLGLTRR